MEIAAQEIIDAYGYSQALDKRRRLPPISGAQVLQLRSCLQRIVDEKGLDICDEHSGFLIDIFDLHICEKLYKTSFELDTLDIIIEHLDICEENCIRLIALVGKMDIILPYERLFEEFGEYMNEETRVRLAKRARKTFVPEVLGFLP